MPIYDYTSKYVCRRVVNKCKNTFIDSIKMSALLTLNDDMHSRGSPLGGFFFNIVNQAFNAQDKHFMLK